MGVGGRNNQEGVGEPELNSSGIPKEGESVRKEKVNNCQRGQRSPGSHLQTVLWPPGDF